MKSMLTTVGTLLFAAIISTPYIIDSGIRPADEEFVSYMNSSVKEFEKLQGYVDTVNNSNYVSIRDYEKYLALIEIHYLSKTEL